MFTLKRGMRVNVLASGQKIDYALICEINLHDPHRDEILIRSLQLNPGKVVALVSTTNDEWKQNSDQIEKKYPSYHDEAFTLEVTS